MTPAQVLAMLPPDTGERRGAGGSLAKPAAEEGTTADLIKLASMTRI